jgi:hypothetical protein
MVQTRSQTRAGAPAPAELWPRPRRRGPAREAPPDEPVPPAPPPPPPPPPSLTLVNILTTRGATQPFIPILASLYRFLNAADLDALLQAFPFLRGPLQDPRAPLPSFRCQDHPPLSCVKEGDPASAWNLLVSIRPGPRAPCNIPGHHMIQHKKCEGYRLGYRFHSENFWVCVHCARRAWERYSLTFKPVNYDLCLHCSRAYRNSNPIAALNECSCQWGGSDAQLHLCTDCRDARGREQHGEDCDMLSGYNSNTDPLHGPLVGLQRRRDRVAHFIDRKGPFGESTCTCGRDVTQKIATYQVTPAAALVMPFVHDFVELVRICSHCRKEKFLCHSFPY